MYWSGFDADTNRKIVSRAGFTLLEAEVVEQEADAGIFVPFLWIIAKKGGSDTDNHLGETNPEALEASASADLRGKQE
jgi:hypothetical protein